MVAITGGGQLTNQFNTELASPHNSIFKIKPRIGSTIVKVGDFRLHGEGKFENGQGLVHLNWDTILGLVDGYLVQRSNDSNMSGGDSSLKVVPTNYGKKVKILNIYPPNGRYLKGWLSQNNGSGQPVNMGLIEVDEVLLPDFNANPNSYLKDNNGNYRYDGIYIGSYDSNGGWTPGVNDLTATSQPVVETFANTGRSLVMGHDTIAYDGFGRHEFINRFAPKVGLKLYPDIISSGGRTTGDNKTMMGTNQVGFTTVGTLNQYPYHLNPTQVYHISPAHTVSQFIDLKSGATRWMNFNIDGTPTQPLFDSQNVHYAYDSSGRLIGDDNWYLVTKDNYAAIQTGHSNGACTPDEAKIIANMIYYTSTLNLEPQGDDFTVEDSNAPDAPSTTLDSINNVQIKVKINTRDNATDYYYRARANDNGTIKYSDVIKTSILSGIKGYIYSIDDNMTGSPTVTRDPSNGSVTNINLNPTSANDPQATVDLSLPNSYGKYFHIVAVDNANNVSTVKTVDVSDYKWWNIDPVTKILTIYRHELNGAVDTDSTENWPWYSQAASVTKIVVSPKVTARGSLKNLFFRLSSATSIEGLQALDTNDVTEMESMFNQCSSLTSINVSNFDTTNVTNMKTMFSGCKKLTKLDLSNFNTLNVIDMTNMLDKDEKLWQVTLGAGSKLSNDAGLENPTEGTSISDLNNYYATSNNWREVEDGSPHDPNGQIKTASQILTESQTRNDKRTYVWDQIGKQTMTAGNNIDFGTHQGSMRDHDYDSAEQVLKITDNRNARSGKTWRIEAKVSKPLILVGDSSKKIFGNPLYHHDLTSDVLTNLTPVSQVIHRETAGSTYLEEFNYPWKMKFKASPSTIPGPGQYKGEVTYTLISEIP